MASLSQTKTNKKSPEEISAAFQGMLARETEKLEVTLGKDEEAVRQGPTAGHVFLKPHDIFSGDKCLFWEKREA